MFRRIAVLLIFGCLTAFANPPATLLSEEQYIPDIATFLQISNWSPAGNSWDGKDVYVILVGVGRGTSLPHYRIWLAVSIDDLSGRSRRI